MPNRPDAVIPRRMTALGKSEQTTADELTVALCRLGGSLARAGLQDSAQQISRIANESTHEPGDQMATGKPKIITMTVKRLRGHATWLAERGHIHAAKDVHEWADELNDYDARETKLDPSKRKRRKTTATRR